MSLGLSGRVGVVLCVVCYMGHCGRVSGYCSFGMSSVNVVVLLAGNCFGPF